MKVLFVCLGNICRSPMADGLLRRKVKEMQLPVEVDSAGTANYHIGKQPDTRMRATARKFDTPIDELRARQFVQNDFDAFDKIYVMDQSNYNDVLRLARNEGDKAKVQMVLNEIFPNSNQPVPDPYYGGEEGFVEVYNLLDDATNVIIDKLKKEIHG
jgi:protein-tyrosine phosphatase